MKIYLGFTVAGNRSTLAAARRIFAALRSLGHEVLTTHLLDDDAWEADRRKPPQEIFARDMNWLAECDVFVAEVSGSSFGLGFETGYVLGSTAKKTILFYERIRTAPSYHMTEQRIYRHSWPTNEPFARRAASTFADS